MRESTDQNAGEVINDTNTKGVDNQLEEGVTYKGKEKSSEHWPELISVRSGAGKQSPNSGSNGTIEIDQEQCKNLQIQRRNHG